MVKIEEASGSPDLSGLSHRQKDPAQGVCLNILTIPRYSLHTAVLCDKCKKIHFFPLHMLLLSRDATGNLINLFFVLSQTSLSDQYLVLRHCLGNCSANFKQPCRMQSRLNPDLDFPLISSYVFKLILIIDVLC